MFIFLITFIIFSINAICLSMLVYQFFSQDKKRMDLKSLLIFCFSGFTAFVAEVLALGSFTVNTAGAKLFRRFNDNNLPAILNAQILPSVFLAFFFLKLFKIDPQTLTVLSIAVTLGGIAGAFYLKKSDVQQKRRWMIAGTSLLILLLLAHYSMLLPFHGRLEALYGWRLFIGFSGMLCCGFMASAGIDLFILIQGVLFFLDASPLIAFPIMAVAAAIQRPVTTLIYLRKSPMDLKPIIILNLAGSVAVIICMPFFNKIIVNYSQLLLLNLLLFNFVAISRDYLKDKEQEEKYPLSVKQAS